MLLQQINGTSTILSTKDRMFSGAKARRVWQGPGRPHTRKFRQGGSKERGKALVTQERVGKGCPGRDGRVRRPQDAADVATEGGDSKEARERPGLGG
jgi:hypothetical protein